MQIHKYKSLIPSETPVEEEDAKKYFILNEVMTSEKDPSILSVYRLNVDGRDLGKFRSSGILIATGTGSTGWLYSARQTTAKQVSNLKRLIGLKGSGENLIDLIDYEMAKEISSESIFAMDSINMYYFVREGF